MRNMIKLDKKEIEKAFEGERRQYFVGNLKNHRTCLFCLPRMWKSV